MRRLVLFVLLAAGCGTRQVPLRAMPDPREPGGVPGEYSLATSDGQRGILRLLSRGVYVENGHTLAHVAVELESSGRTGMRLDVGALRLEAFRGTEATPALRPSSTTGTAQIPPRGYGHLDALFELPADLRPGDVTALAVAWAAQLGDEKRDGLTHFGRVNERRRGRQPVAHGPFMPGSGTRSPTGEWYTCPDDPFHYYPYPPECL